MNPKKDMYPELSREQEEGICETRGVFGFCDNCKEYVIPLGAYDDGVHIFICPKCHYEVILK